jgi:multicomponent Na+:H+ antiporter subunit B
MDSIIVRTAARLMLPLLILFSIFLLLRGHNAPGGGFAGGLVAAAAIILLALAGGLRDAEAILPAAMARYLMPLGLLLAGGSAVLPLLAGKAFMEGLWLEDVHSSSILSNAELGTPVLFDVGVYVVVVGMVLTVVLRLIAEVEQWKS